MDKSIYTKATCQIFANNIEFDWENPYKTYSEYISTGTGFFIDDNGTLLTCAHVVDSSIKTLINVPDNGKNKIDVELISINYEKDIALLRTQNFKNKAFLLLGDSDKVSEQDTVVTVGFPLGEDRIKFTGGIVSGVQGKYIQTDAPINSGNSGGPLILKRTNSVVGVNTAKMSQADNIGYVSPINDFIILIQDMYNCAYKENKEDRILTVPDLGCSFMSTDENLLEFLGAKGESGYMIRDIAASSPLKKGGIKPKDILIKIGNYSIDNYGEIDVPWSTQKIHIDDIVHRYKHGNNIDVTYWCSREKKQKTIAVKFDVKYPYAIKRIMPIITPPEFETVYGLVVMPLYFNHLELLGGLSWNKKKKNILFNYSKKNARSKPVLVVSNVLPGSYVKDNESLTGGDIIDTVNNIKTRTISEFREAFLKPINNFIVIESKSKNILVIKVSDILKHDRFLSEKYKYPISNLVLKLPLSDNSENNSENILNDTNRYLDNLRNNNSNNDNSSNVLSIKHGHNDPNNRCSIYTKSNNKHIDASLPENSEDE